MMRAFASNLDTVSRFACGSSVASNVSLASAGTDPA
jgi:hypothetical protein